MLAGQFVPSVAVELKPHLSRLVQGMSWNGMEGEQRELRYMKTHNNNNNNNILTTNKRSSKFTCWLFKRIIYCHNNSLNYCTKTPPFSGIIYGMVYFMEMRVRVLTERELNAGKLWLFCGIISDSCFVSQLRSGIQGNCCGASIAWVVKGFTSWYQQWPCPQTYWTSWSPNNHSITGNRLSLRSRLNPHSI